MCTDSCGRALHLFNGGGIQTDYMVLADCWIPCSFTVFPMKAGLRETGRTDSRVWEPPLLYTTEQLPPTARAFVLFQLRSCLLLGRRHPRAEG